MPSRSQLQHRQQVHMMIQDLIPSPTPAQVGVPAWRKVVARYQQASLGRAVWQLCNTLVPYLGLWFLMYLYLDVSYWLVAPLAVLAGAFMVRAFIIITSTTSAPAFRITTSKSATAPRRYSKLSNP